MSGLTTLQSQGTEFNRRKAIAHAAVALGGFALGGARARAEFKKEEISHSEEAIHQEAFFKADPKRVYDALTDQGQFDKVTRFSDAIKAADQGEAPTEISSKAGGAFRIFGGHIFGWQLELVPHERIVQAWRVDGWDAGVYSVARFELTPQASGTKIVLDHTGFPKGSAEHLAEGWKSHYWGPLEKFLG